MDLDMKQVLQMMGEMNASIQGLAVELRSSIKGLEGRFDGLEKRFDGLEKRFDGLEGRFDGLEGRFDGLEGRFDGLEGRFDGLEKRFDGLEGRFEASEKRLNAKSDRLAMAFDRSSHELKADFERAVEKMLGIYGHAAWAVDSAKVSSNKAISHGRMLMDHEDRIRALEGKRKTRPAA